MKALILGALGRLGAWLWALVLNVARKDVAARDAVEEIQDDIRTKDLAKALEIERAAAAAAADARRVRDPPDAGPEGSPAARIEARRGRRPS